MHNPINKKIVELQTIISAAGIPNTVIPDDHGGRLVCANDQSEHGLHGGSIWFAVRGDCVWYVGTWGPRLYRVPDHLQCADLLSVCNKCLSSLPSASSGIAPEVLREFGLVEMRPESIWRNH